MKNRPPKTTDAITLVILPSPVIRVTVDTAGIEFNRSVVSSANTLDRSEFGEEDTG
jgi:hypothetical protein